MFRKRLIVKIGLLAVVIVMAVSLASFAPTRVIVTGEGNLSLETNVALAVNNPPASEITEQRYTGITTVEETSWGYLYTLENGDIVEVGDSTTTDFKAHVKTIRWNGAVDFSLWQESGTFIPTLDGTTVSFDFSANVHVSIYPSPPCERIPEGGIEYDITLSKKPAKPTVTLNADWNNVTWQKIYGLDVEYDQAACEEEWGVDLSPFIITPTSITSDATQEVLKTRPEYEVNSYLGTCTSPTIKQNDMGNNVFYSNVSRSHLRIHRGEMTDALSNTAWIDDITLDEQNKTFTFALPKTWLQGAEYPVHQVCGVDPAYTEDMDFWVTDTYGDSDNTWSDYDIFTEKGVPKGAVAEIIFAMQEPGVENTMGIRTDGSSLERKVILHEAEGGGVTTCRMFVLCDASTGLIEGYHSDVSDDDSFYLVGYWENVGFTERWDIEVSNGNVWDEIVLTAGAGAASRVCHFIGGMIGQDQSLVFGVRDTSSAVDRSIRVHEAEGGGGSWIDMTTKADSSHSVDLYKGFEAGKAITIYMAGYFGSELDFVESFQDVSLSSSNVWVNKDLSAYLDEDGRTCDFLLLNSETGTENTIGVRINGSSLNRVFTEHEAEDDGGSTGELTGFGITAETDALGYVRMWKTSAGATFYLMGYFKPAAGGEADISNTPDSKAFGVVSNSTTYWSDGSEPSWPLTDGDAYFTITNNGDTCSITITATNFTGGVGWTLGVPAENYARITAFKEGDGSGDGITLTTSPQSFITGLSTDIDWEFKLETPTAVTDGAGKTSTVTLAATLD